MQTQPLVIIPTYNEAENVAALVDELRQLPVKLDILFVDDNSPDGTGDLIESMMTNTERLFLLRRPGKQGIGSAHVAGLDWAFDRGYSTVLTMDADFSHRPIYLTQLLDRAERADVVIGSRYMKQESLRDWNLLRTTLTRTGHFLTRVFLGMPHDATGALRLYRLDRIPQRLFHIVRSTGYSFFFESLFVLVKNGLRIEEVPIDLPRRTYGHSKMSFVEVLNSVILLVTLYVLSKLNPELFLIGLPFPNGVIARDVSDPQGWDGYWSRKSDSIGKLYDLGASIYREMLLRPSLNHFSMKYFSPGGSVLHAGCGGGQVDRNVREHFQITAVDISPAALRGYWQLNGRFAKILRASFFSLPLPDRSFDAVYNLGAMEHFSPDDAKQIFGELSRVLKDDGVLLLFWPPVFSFSVFVLKLCSGLVRFFKPGREVPLFPPEVNRVRSRSQITSMMSDAGFTVVEYSFGPRDLFSQCAIVCRKSNAEMQSSGSDAASDFERPKTVSTAT